jgi:hypothetical protein
MPRVCHSRLLSFSLAFCADSTFIGRKLFARLDAHANRIHDLMIADAEIAMNWDG